MKGVISCYRIPPDYQTQSLLQLGRINGVSILATHAHVKQNPVLFWQRLRLSQCSNAPRHDRDFKIKTKYLVLDFDMPERWTTRRKQKFPEAYFSVASAPPLRCWGRLVTTPISREPEQQQKRVVGTFVRMIAREPAKESAEPNRGEKQEIGRTCPRGKTSGRARHTQQR